MAPFNARLAQLVERKALNLVVVGSSPTVGTSFFALVKIEGREVSTWVAMQVTSRTK